MVEQNARRALAMSDRGYVLDLGQDRFEGPGKELLDDPKVAELYLGGTARVDRPDGRDVAREAKRPGTEPRPLAAVVAVAGDRFALCATRRRLPTGIGSRPE